MSADDILEAGNKQLMTELNTISTKEIPPYLRLLLLVYPLTSCPHRDVMKIVFHKKVVRHTHHLDTSYDESALFERLSLGAAEYALAEIEMAAGEGPRS